MPSPFPGMDPYLENPTLWPDVHHALISNMREFLLPQLRPAYFAQIEERVYVLEEFDDRAQSIAPSISITEVDPYSTASGGETVVMTEPYSIVTMIDFEVHEARLEIRDAASREVVTVIEVLSPANKDRGSTGFDSYDRKRREVLHSKAHFVEIDLLRAGYRYSLPRRKLDADYRVHVSKAHDRPYGLVWPIRLPSRLPVIRIPLKQGEPDVNLDLQNLIDSTYERAGYDLIVDYLRPPAVPLSEAGQRWVETILATKQTVTE